MATMCSMAAKTSTPRRYSSSLPRPPLPTPRPSPFQLLPLPSRPFTSPGWPVRRDPDKRLPLRTQLSDDATQRVPFSPALWFGPAASSLILVVRNRTDNKQKREKWCAFAARSSPPTTASAPPHAPLPAIFPTKPRCEPGGCPATPHLKPRTRVLWFPSADAGHSSRAIFSSSRLLLLSLHLYPLLAGAFGWPAVKGMQVHGERVRLGITCSASTLMTDAQTLALRDPED